MPLITENRLRTRAQNELSKEGYGSTFESANARAKNMVKGWVNEQRTFSAVSKTYDIFLSHSTSDAELVSGLKLTLEDLGHTVYVDWIEDPNLIRSHVTKETALLLQGRMKQSKSLIYAFSENAVNSKWMPWELGYFDGLKGGKVAVLPISQNTKSDFVGTEYLGIYYYVQIDTNMGTNNLALWIHEKANKYVRYDYWLAGNAPTEK